MILLNYQKTIESDLLGNSNGDTDFSLEALIITILVLIAIPQIIRLIIYIIDHKKNK